MDAKKSEFVLPPLPELKFFKAELLDQEVARIQKDKQSNLTNLEYISAPDPTKSSDPQDSLDKLNRNIEYATITRENMELDKQFGA